MPKEGLPCAKEVLTNQRAAPGPSYFSDRHDFPTWLTT